LPAKVNMYDVVFNVYIFVTVSFTDVWY
jgi:hypothetical protein